MKNKTGYTYDRNNQFNDHDETYVDYKCDSLRFPEYEGNRNGEVVSYRIEDLVNVK